MTTSGGPETWDADQLKRQLQAMDNYDFEHLVAELWEQRGWNTEVEQQSGDAGVDVRATKDVPYSQKALIQAKRYSSDNTLGGPDIQQYAALKHQEENVDKAIVVTTGRFTSSAEERGKDLNVKLIDGDDLVEIIEQTNAYDAVEEYVGVSTSGSDGEFSSSTTSQDDDFYIPPKRREQLDEVIDGDVEEYLLDQQYRATRALEQAQAQVKINPHDAAQIGVFNEVAGVDGLDPERKFEQQKVEIAALSDHVHVDGEGDAFVGDLTEFINGSAVDVKPNQNIVGIIERGVRDESWVADGLLQKFFLYAAKQSQPDTQTTSSDSGSSPEETAPTEQASSPSPASSEISLFSGGITHKLKAIAAGHDSFHYLAIGGFVITIASFFLVGTFPESPVAIIGVLVFLVSPIAGIMGLLMDLAHIKQQDSDWTPYISLGFLGAVLFSPLYFGYYVYKRWKHIGM